jgi:hypothetical protein
MSLLGGTDGSSNAKSDADGTAVHTFEESPATSAVKDKRSEALQHLRDARNFESNQGLSFSPNPDFFSSG